MKTLVLFLLAAASINAQPIQTPPVAPVKPDAERSGLHGKVQTLHTESGFPQADTGFVVWRSFTEVTYNTEGWVTEVTRFVGSNQVYQRVIERDGQRLIRTESDSWEPPDPHSEITTCDSAGRPVELLTKNRDGTLRERTTRQYEENGILETTYDGSGGLKDSYVWHATDVQSGDKSISETYADNELESRTIVQQNNNATHEETTNYGRDGKVSSTMTQESKDGITNLVRTDKSGNPVVSDTRDGSGHLRARTVYDKNFFMKTTYDADGRMIRMERHASNGKLLNAFVYSYQNDDHGNWIRQTTSTELPHGQSHVTEIVSRRITYY